MFEYEWGNPSSILFPPPAADPVDDDHHRHTAEGAYSHVDATDIPSFIPPAFLPLHHSNNHFHAFPTATADPRGFPSASYPPAPPSLLSSSDFDSPDAFFTLPKPEPPGCGSSADLDRIGLNLGLGGRTYFSAAEEGFLSRLYRRSRPFDGGLGGSLAANSPKCQAEGCNADLSNAKHYHRRHKVCEFHSKSSTVVAGGLTQRFCQQCSRFHLLTEFDNGKRSCRRRLTDHNRRRRKSHRTDNAGNSSSCSENPPRSPSESRAHSVSSVAVSPPMEVSKLTCYNSSEASPSVSSSSIFY